MTTTPTSDGAVRVTLHPGEDLLLRQGARLGALRAPLAALVRRPELRWARLTADGAALGDDQVVGVRPLLPGVVLRAGRPGSNGDGADGGEGDGGAGGGDPTRAGPGAGLAGRWLVVRVAGPAAGTVVGAGGAWAALRTWVRLRHGGRLVIRRSRGPATWLGPGPAAAPGGLSWPLVLLPAVASLVLAAALRQPVLAVFALVGLAVAAPQLRAARQRTVPRDGTRGTVRKLPGPAHLLAFAYAASHVSTGAWAAAREAWSADKAGGGPGSGAAPRGPAPGPGAPWAALLRDGCVAVLGPGDLARSVARALVAGPAARGAAVRVADDAPGWSWLRWLPGGGPTVLVVDGLPDGGRAAVGDVVPSGPGAPGAVAATAGPVPPALVMSVGTVPPGCRSVVRVLDARRVRITAPDGAARVVPLVGVTAEWAEHLARLLAGGAWLGRTAAALGGPSGTGDDLVGRGSGGMLGGAARTGGPVARPDDPRLPATVSLTRAHGLDEVPGPDLVAARWSGAEGWAVPLGIGADGGPVLLDLVRDGPHLLVAGTTGSGKSELLQTLVLGLALTRSPTDLALVLVDFKGGASLGVCGRLPHVVGQVTDLEPGLAARALSGLRAELRRRERVLADHDVADVVALAPGVLPRLVVVIDEFRALADDLPAFLPALLRVAAQGRSLGVHLVLATQRPGGAVGPDLRANVSARVALRVTDPLESRDVVDDPAAAYLPRTAPGRAVLRIGSAPPAVLQCAHATAAPEARTPLVRRAPARAVGRASALVIAVPADAVRSPAKADAASRDSAGPDVATLVVDATRHAAQALGHRPAEPPWLPPLPRSAGVACLPPRARRDRAGLALALGDDPDRQRRTTVTWRPEDGHLAVVGQARSGRTTALVTLGLAALRQGWTVHGFARDAAGLAALAHHPAYGGTHRPDDAGAFAHLLPDAVDNGNGTGTGTGTPRPVTPGTSTPDVDRTLVLVDGIEDARGALPAAALRSGIAFAVTADGPSVGGLAARFGPRLVLLGTDRASDVVLGAPVRLAGAGGPPGRAAWCGRGEPALCQVLDPGRLEPDGIGPDQREPERTGALSPPSGSPTSPRRRRAS
ncbi:FtsK/SpoIIIE domain-containing protein [Promicromonospora sukumoe]|uniref:S-DNA-T family DNA segregation ATPase FtsK/SpoIIIE n=1 Tax=Promicromonospora sukumoe TaxID=88382 RepID=A0A7W3PFE3_9MICO|nr:FtsK/SpoIIIE domain-containing protein [Promicromonospora sukumoe]MBA8810045.1 S-DNA-T family DNA segregation ATPase FtsK/SpoIIIE [Promicromonospora sukumoe]